MKLKNKAESSLEIEELTGEGHSNSSNDEVNELVFKSEKGNLVTTSLLVAEKFGKKHFHVMDAIKNILSSHEKSCQVFHLTTYTDMSGKSNPMYLMNRDGFSLLVMGFTGKKAFPEKNLAHILNAQKNER